MDAEERKRIADELGIDVEDLELMPKEKDQSLQIQHKSVSVDDGFITANTSSPKNLSPSK